MAINKRKVLQAAQKHLQKGALDKALKEYEKLLQADPKDFNVRMKMGDVQLRAGHTEEAISAYSKVAAHYADQGFDAKAVALYKQILKVDSKRVDVHEPLAELYERLGLPKDAMASLETAAEAYHQEGNKKRALDVLRKIADLDPSNTAHRLKVGELLRAEGMNEDAASEFAAAAEELGHQGDESGRSAALRKVLELEPERHDLRTELAGSFLEQRAFAEAAELFEELVAGSAAAEIPVHEQLADAYRGLGRESDLPPIYRRIADLMRARGDEAGARDIIQRYVPMEFSASDVPKTPVPDPTPVPNDEVIALGGDEPESDPELVLDEQLVDAANDDALELDLSGSELPPLESEVAEKPEDIVLDPSFDAELPELSGEVEIPLTEATGEEEVLEVVDEPSIDVVIQETTEEPVVAEPTPEPEPKAEIDEMPRGPGESLPDPSQLLAEAAVYIRYGKQDRAIESLRSILSLAPDHREALSKLGECLEAKGDGFGAAEAYAHAARLYRDDGHAEAFEALKIKVEALDPEAAAELAPPSPPEADAVESDEIGEASEIVEVETTEAEEEEAEEEISLDVSIPDFEAAETAETDESPEDAQDEFDVDASVSFDEAIQQPFAEVAEALTPEDTSSSDLGLPIDEASALREQAAAEALERVAAEVTGEHALGVDSEEGSQEIVLEPVNDEGWDEDEFVTPDDEVNLKDLEASLSSTELDEALDLPPSKAPETDTGTEEPAASSSMHPEQLTSELQEAEFYFEQEMLEEAEGAYRRILEIIPQQPQALVRLGEIENALAQRNAAADQAEPSQPENDEALVSTEDVSFDIGEEEDEAEADPSESLARLDDEAAAILENESLAEDAFGGEEDDFQVGAGDTSELHDALAEVAAEQSIDPDLDLAEDEEEADGAEVTGESDSGEFDLAAELADAGDSRDGVTTDAPAAAGFEQVFSDFKRHIEKEVDAGDVDTHYDLGIAYREMDLLEDALHEFRVASAGEARKLECFHMMGLCALGLERHDEAINHLEQALAFPELPEDQVTALRFDLGLACQAAGDVAKALDYMQQVAASDSDFRDCQERIQALESGEAGPPTAAGSEEMFESFDDLIADTQGESDAEDDADESPMESYETFDDLCDEVEAEMDARDEAERASDIPPDATDEIPAGFSSEELPLDEGDDATGEFVAAGQGETAEFAPPSLSEVTTGEFVDPEEDVETGELVVEAEDETPVPETVTDPGEDAPAKPKAGKRKRKISFV